MITGELRVLLADINWTEIIDHMQTSAGAIVDGDWLDAWHEAASNACNAIDAVHANLERENAAIKASVAHAYASGYEYAEQDRDGWVELPKDADGVPIRVGDVMEGEKIGGGLCEPFEVVGYIMSNGEFEPMDEHKLPRKRKYLHHHAPTVEDVLMEFMNVMLRTSSKDTASRIAEYAAKLRLAGDAE